MTDAKVLKFRFHHELQGVYQRFFDELASSDLRDGEAARLAQALLLSRQESSKYLVPAQDMSAYLEAYPEDAGD